MLDPFFHFAFMSKTSTSLISVSAPPPGLVLVHEFTFEDVDLLFLGTFQSANYGNFTPALTVGRGGNFPPSFCYFWYTLV